MINLALEVAAGLFLAVVGFTTIGLAILGLVKLFSRKPDTQLLKEIGRRRA